MTSTVGFLLGSGEGSIVTASGASAAASALLLSGGLRRLSAGGWYYLDGGGRVTGAYSWVWVLAAPAARRVHQAAKGTLGVLLQWGRRGEPLPRGGHMDEEHGDTARGLEEGRRFLGRLRAEFVALIAENERLRADSERLAALAIESTRLREETARVQAERDELVAAFALIADLVREIQSWRAGGRGGVEHA